MRESKETAVAVSSSAWASPAAVASTASVSRASVTSEISVYSERTRVEWSMRDNLSFLDLSNPTEAANDSTSASEIRFSILKRLYLGQSSCTISLGETASSPVNTNPTELPPHVPKHNFSTFPNNKSAMRFAYRNLAFDQPESKDNYYGRKVGLF